MSDEDRSQDVSGFLRFLLQRGITEPQADEANRKREALLDRLDDRGIGCSFYGSKLFSGTLSPGCQSCAAGSWSCTYLTKSCTADCFFCPSESLDADSLPKSSDLQFPSLEAYLAYLAFFDFEGVSFSGGEPLLSYEEMLTWIPQVKKRDGRDRYVWMYTNGDLLDEKMLAALQAAGLDEIRINIAARDYALDPVRLARRHIGTVTVEIPTIPEDVVLLKERLVALQGLGVDHINLHQLFANRINYQALADRGYTFMPPVGSAAPVLESEMAALELLLFTLEEDVELPINYCSTLYRTRCDELARRRRSAAVAVNDWDSITEAGYVRRLSVTGHAECIEQITRGLNQAKVATNLWQVVEGGRRLDFHPSLLALPTLAGEMVELRHYETQLIDRATGAATLYDPVALVELGGGLILTTGERLVTTPAVLQAKAMGAWTGRERPDYERMGRGLQPVLPCDSLLETAAG